MTKKILFLLLILFCVISPAFAQESQAQAAVNANAKIRRDSVAKYFKKGSSQMEDMAAYLFNMYLLTKFEPAGINGKFTLGHIGAADTLSKYNLSEAQFSAAYVAVGAKIRGHLQNYFKELCMIYDASGENGNPANFRQELTFLLMLQHSADKDHYICEGGAPPPSAAYSEALAASLKGEMSKAISRLENKAVVHPPGGRVPLTSWIEADGDCMSGKLEDINSAKANKSYGHVSPYKH